MFYRVAVHLSLTLHVQIPPCPIDVSSAPELSFPTSSLPGSLTYTSCLALAIQLFITPIAAAHLHTAYKYSTAPGPYGGAGTQVLVCVLQHLSTTLSCQPQILGFVICFGRSPTVVQEFPKSFAIHLQLPPLHITL